MPRKKLQELHLIDGTESEGQKVEGIHGRPACPRNLPQRAREEWRRVVPQLEEMGILSKVDRIAVANYCMAVSVIWDCLDVVNREGLTFTSDNGNLRPRPEAQLLRDYQKMVNVFACQLGMTPDARNKMAYKLPDKAADEWDTKPPGLNMR